MPLFMAVSGFVSFDSIQRYRLAEYVKRRFVSLLLPFISWLIVLCIFKRDFELFLNNIQYLGGLWFLYVLFFVETIVMLCYSIGRETKCHYISYLLLFFFLGIMCFLSFGLHNEQFGFSLIVYYMPFFLCGILVRRFNILNEINIKVIILLMILFVVMAFFCDDNQFERLLNDIGWSDKLIAIYEMVVAFVAIFGLMPLFKRYMGKQFKYISYIGKKTLAIYAISWTFQVVFWNEIRMPVSCLNNILAVLLLTVFIFGFSLILEWVLSMNKFTNLVFFGK